MTTNQRYNMHAKNFVWGDSAEWIVDVLLFLYWFESQTFEYTDTEGFLWDNEKW